MKKILVMILALCCAFAMFSCGDAEYIGDFNNAIKATKPTVVKVEVVAKSALGELNSVYTTTYNEDGSFAIEYTKESFNSASDGESDDVIKTETGSVSCDANGKYSDGGDIAGTLADAKGVSLKLSEKTMKASVSADGNVLTATVAAKNTASVFGVEYAGDVTLVITKAQDKIVSYTMSYQANETTAISVVCTFK